VVLQSTRWPRESSALNQNGGNVKRVVTARASIPRGHVNKPLEDVESNSRAHALCMHPRWKFGTARTMVKYHARKDSRKTRPSLTEALKAGTEFSSDCSTTDLQFNNGGHTFVAEWCVQWHRKAARNTINPGCTAWAWRRECHEGSCGYCHPAKLRVRSGEMGSPLCVLN